MTCLFGMVLGWGDGELVGTVHDMGWDGMRVMCLCLSMLTQVSIYLGKYEYRSFALSSVVIKQ